MRNGETMHQGNDALGSYGIVHGFPDQSSRTKGWEKAIMGCLIPALVFLAVLVVGIVLGANEFVAFGISSDITDYIAIIEKSDLDTDTKIDLRQRFENIRDLARKGEHVGFWVWLDYDESIENLIGDGKITEQELAALTRELERLERPW
jgi:hypothetical protein